MLAMDHCFNFVMNESLSCNLVIKQSIHFLLQYRYYEYSIKIIQHIDNLTAYTFKIFGASCFKTK